MKTIYIIIIAIALFTTFWLIGRKKASDDYIEMIYEPKPTKHSEIENQLLKLINDYRVLNNKNVLETDENIRLYCKYHNEEMIFENRVYHSEYASVVLNQGAKAFGENVGYKYRTVKAMFNAWKKSVAHNRTMLGSFTHFSLNINGKYYTNMFIRV